MSFTKIAPKEVKLRCWRCGKTRNVQTIGKNDICSRCFKALCAQGIQAIGAK